MFWNKSRALEAAAEAAATAAADGVRLDEALAPYAEATEGPAGAYLRRAKEPLRLARRLVSIAGNTLRPASSEKV